VSKPSLLFLSHEFPPLGGGAGLNGFYLCEELHRRGWAVHVVTERPPRGAMVPFPFPITYIPSGRARRLQTSFVSMVLFIAGALAFRLKRRGLFDVVFSNMAIPAAIAGTLMTMANKTPHIVWHHGGDVHGGKPRGARRIQRMLLRYIWKRTRANCFVSEGLRAMAQSYGGLCNASIIPVAPSIDLKASASCMHGPRYFLFLGRLEKVKNPLLLIAAMEELKKLLSTPPPLRIIGDGKLYKAVDKEIRGRNLEKLITLQRDIPHDQVAKALQSSHALICCSLIEGLNMTILEAASCGVPTIGSDVPEINALLDNRKNGLLFESDNAYQLASCIKELYENPSLRDILGKNAAQTASAFSIRRSADAFERLCAVFSVTASASGSGENEHLDE